MQITNPSIDTKFQDESKSDSSITQDKTTVNLGSGATYNQNCGNDSDGSRLTRLIATMIVLGISTLLDIGLGIGIYQLNVENKLRQENMLNAMQQMSQNAERAHAEINARHIGMMQKSETAHSEMMAKAKEGTIWLLRDDIIKTIDLHEVSKQITSKEYKRLKDEFVYYKSIGGNHDVQDRWDMFAMKVLSGEIKMMLEAAK